MSNAETGPAGAGQDRLQERGSIETRIRVKYNRLAWRQRITGISCFLIGLVNGFVAGAAFYDAGEVSAGHEQPRSVERYIADLALIAGSAEVIRRLSTATKNAKAKTYSVCDDLVGTYAQRYRSDDPDIRYYRPEPVIEDGKPRMGRVHDAATFDGSRRDYDYATKGMKLKDRGRDACAAASGFAIGTGAGTLNESLPNGAVTTIVIMGAFSALLSSAHQLLDEGANRAYVSDFVNQLDNLDYGSGLTNGTPPSPET